MLQVVAPFGGVVLATVADGRSVEELDDDNGDSAAGEMVKGGETNVENLDDVGDTAGGLLIGTTEAIDAEESIVGAAALDCLNEVVVCAECDDIELEEAEEITPTVIVDNTVSVGRGLPLVATEDGTGKDVVAAELGVSKDPVIPSSLEVKRLER